jgi:hypothetical protein
VRLAWSLVLVESVFYFRTTGKLFTLEQAVGGPKGVFIDNTGHTEKTLPDSFPAALNNSLRPLATVKAAS